MPQKRGCSPRRKLRRGRNPQLWQQDARAHLAPVHYDAETTVAGFAARLKDAVDLDAVQADLTSAVQQTLEPAQVSVWISTATEAGCRRSAATPRPGRRGSSRA